MKKRKFKIITVCADCRGVVQNDICTKCGANNYKKWLKGCLSSSIFSKADKAIIRQRLKSL